MKRRSSEPILYEIVEINLCEQTVLMRTSLPIDVLRKSRLQNFLFPDPPIRVTDLRATARGGSTYSLSFAEIKPETNFPPIYPIWRKDTFAIPLWCLMLVPEPCSKRPAKVAIGREGKRALIDGSVQLICPRVLTSISALSGFCLFGGYESANLAMSDTRITLHFANASDRHYLLDVVKRVLSTHEKFFGEWLWPRIHMLFEAQQPRLRKQKAMLFSDKSLALGRYILQSIEPQDPFEKITQQDIIEHEILHYYIDTASPAGSWLVEGLTTYLSRKLLFEAGILTELDWICLVRDALKECGNNPLCHTTTLNAATARYWDVRYGNVIYNKGFLLACLIDQELVGGLMSIAKDLYQNKIRFGHQFSEADFLERLPFRFRNRFLRLLRKKNLSAEFEKVRALAG